MSPFQHIYRRGHIFWWRRNLRLSDGSTVEIRLSLRTYERSQAVSRGAALTAACGGVLAMLNRTIELAATKPTEAQLQSIAKAENEQLLAELCTEQRSSPYHAESHSAANLTLVDYYDRLARNGGHMSLLRQEERQLAARGWDERRIADLSHIVKKREDEGITRLRDEVIDARLRAAGLEPTDEARWMVELVLYPAYRDAHRDAELDLQKTLGVVHDRRADETATPRAPSLVPATVPASPQHVALQDAALDLSAIPLNWRTVTPTEAAERLIVHRPALWEHRRSGKRGVSQVGEQTLRQIRWAAMLLEKSMKGRPLVTITEEDLKDLDKWFEVLPITCGKAPWHAQSATTLEEICREAEERIESGDCEADVIGLQVGTTNKHFRKLKQIYEYARKKVGDVMPELDFSAYISPEIKNERDARAAYTVEQGKELFLLPPWTGCQSVGERLLPGENIYHDALYFVLLLVWYTG
ncbi:MAG: hypothetical protein H7Y62_02435, partial [Hyphomicrobium sp.]|nr:hypothetical protein [Hyphomicrobium sp.]